MGTAVMVYMSEIAMPQFRGALLSAFSLGFALGQVFIAVGFKVLNDTAPTLFRRIFYSKVATLRARRHFEDLLGPYPGTTLITNTP